MMDVDPAVSCVFRQRSAWKSVCRREAKISITLFSEILPDKSFQQLHAWQHTEDNPHNQQLPTLAGSQPTNLVLKKSADKLIGTRKLETRPRTN